VSTDDLVAAARRLVELGPEAFSGPATDAFVERLWAAHPAGALYRKATAEAIAERDVPGVTPEDAAAGVYANFLWTHFVVKLIMTATPAVAIDFAAAHYDFGEVARALDTGGPAILSCFHYTAYPLVALGLALSPIAPLISKARVDVLEQSGSQIGDHVVYLSDPSAAIRMTRALKQGRSVWILLDVVLPNVRVVPARFLGRGMNVGAGIGKIARLSGRPCLPLFWEPGDAGTTLRAGTPVTPRERSEETVIQDFVTTQAEFIARHPTQWLEWYSVLDHAPDIRAEVKRGNEELWARLSAALPASR
jgi:hypothetical protein